jgi:hypothetical protein
LKIRLTLEDCPRPFAASLAITYTLVILRGAVRNGIAVTDSVEKTIVASFGQVSDFIADSQS